MAGIQTFSFNFVDRPRAEVIKDVGLTLQCQMSSAGTQAIPSSASISIVMPGGGPMATPVSGAVVSVDGSGNMTYALTAGNSATLGRNYTATWSIVLSGVTYLAKQLFDVVRVPFRCTVTPTDLSLHHPNISNLEFTSESSTHSQKAIELAFCWAIDIMRGKGQSPNLNLNVEDFRSAIEHRALYYFFFGRSAKAGDHYDYLAKEHERQADICIQTVNRVYDADDSGSVDGSTEFNSSGGEEGRTSQFGWKV